MFPHNQHHTLLYSSAVESFGVCTVQPTPKKTTPTLKTYAATKKKATMATATKKKSTTATTATTTAGKRLLTLTDLPFEMLEKIFSFLDSFR